MFIWEQWMRAGIISASYLRYACEAGSQSSQMNEIVGGFS
ncbi:hypothetical protein B4110_1016 [Parageobacillus toebii]|uniref:Uncharacterized protein n=1 Tax=Parageobacillus toebii TaxID=153151 RepID=A0A150N6E4_9BACL|nr:hypothetical protein B4110_1016 [Parageobacillus toebii]